MKLVEKLSSTEYTIEGLKIVAKGKFFKIFNSPFNFDLAYLESTALFIPSAEI